MTATIVPFRRDLTRVLAELTKIPPNATEEDLHARLEQVIKARDEAIDQRDAGVITTKTKDLFTIAMTELDQIATEQGVDPAVVAHFNANRRDRREYKEAERRFLASADGY